MRDERHHLHSVMRKTVGQTLKEMKASANEKGTSNTPGPEGLY